MGFPLAAKDDIGVCFLPNELSTFLLQSLVELKMECGIGRGKQMMERRIKHWLKERIVRDYWKQIKLQDPIVKQKRFNLDEKRRFYCWHGYQHTC